jgi:hypothetical protein
MPSKEGTGTVEQMAPKKRESDPGLLLAGENKVNLRSYAAKSRP